jgi:hypothetical protein
MNGCQIGTQFPILRVNKTRCVLLVSVMRVVCSCWSLSNLLIRLSGWRLDASPVHRDVHPYVLSDFLSVRPSIPPRFCPSTGIWLAGGLSAPALTPGL